MFLWKAYFNNFPLTAEAEMKNRVKIKNKNNSKCLLGSDICGDECEYLIFSSPMKR